MQMPGGRHDTSLDSLSFGDVRDRRNRTKFRSARTVHRYKPVSEANVPTTVATWTYVDLRQNDSSEDNLDSVDVDRRPSTSDDADNTVLSETLDRSRSRLNKFIDAVGKPFARKRSKSVDALVGRRRPAAEVSPPASTDDQLSHSAHTSASTSMVTLAQFANGQIPGTVGIRNHGNTCFMNAIIQCLSNTEFFTEYFVTNEFDTTLLAAQQAGRACAVTKQLSRLLSSLWTCNYSYQVSAAFRAVVGRSAEQYQGTEQNDAQEFLQWLLDRVNEDLYGTGVTNNRALYSIKYKVFFNILALDFPFFDLN